MARKVNFGEIILKENTSQKNCLRSPWTFYFKTLCISPSHSGSSLLPILPHFPEMFGGLFFAPQSLPWFSCFWCFAFLCLHSFPWQMHLGLNSNISLPLGSLLQPLTHKELLFPMAVAWPQLWHFPKRERTVVLKQGIPRISPELLEIQIPDL